MEFSKELKVWYITWLYSHIVEPDLEKHRLTVQFVDKERNVVVAADENYEQHEIPLKLVQGAENLLEPGVALGLTTDGDVPIKVSLPTNVLTQIRKQ